MSHSIVPLAESHWPVVLACFGSLGDTRRMLHPNFDRQVKVAEATRDRADMKFCDVLHKVSW